MGAAFATSLGTVVGGLMTLVYLMHYSHDLRLYRIKLSRKSLRMTFRNIGYMVKLGNSAFVSEASIAYDVPRQLCLYPESGRRRGSCLQYCLLLFSPSYLWYIMRLHNLPSRLSAITSSRTAGTCTEGTASFAAYSFDLRNLLFHTHNAMLPEHSRTVYRPQLFRL